MLTRLAEYGMHWVDLPVIVFLLYGLIRGALRGFSGELARLLYVLGAMAGASLAHPVLADLLRGHTRLEEADADRLGLVLAAVLSIIAVLLIRLLVRKLFQFNFKGKLEKVGGAILGLASALVLVSALFILAARAPWPGVRDVARSGSLTGRTAEFLFPPLYRQLAGRMDLPPLPPAPGETVAPGTGSDLPDAPATEEVAEPGWTEPLDVQE
jgi:uncharacterized membrane protein required for colicin V production